MTPDRDVSRPIVSDGMGPLTCVRVMSESGTTCDVCGGRLVPVRLIDEGLSKKVTVWFRIGGHGMWRVFEDGRTEYMKDREWMRCVKCATALALYDDWVGYVKASVGGRYFVNI